MKAKLLLDQWADITKVPEHLRASVVPVFLPRGRIDYKYPKGTIFEGEQALFMCRTGQCEPLDEECVAALELSPAQRAVLQTNYKMDSLGLDNKEDRELYRAGVINGLVKKDGVMEYIHGPNWDAYQAAKEESKKAEDDL